METRVPGLAAQHAVITPTCRANKGSGGAWREAVERLRQEYEGCQVEANDAATYHLVLTVDRGVRDEQELAARAFDELAPEVRRPACTKVEDIEEAVE